MTSVRLYYIKYDARSEHVPLDKKQQERWSSELSVQKRGAVERLVNSNDRIMSLLGSQLIKLCARDEAVDDFRLADVVYPEAGKPYWQSKQGSVIDFNISHSNSCVMVAVSRTVKVGVDIEKIRQLKNLNFKMVMLPDELKLIRETPALFFELWSRKEAVVKAANTSGISRMRDVALTGNLAVLDGTSWHLRNINADDELDNSYEISLATSELVDELKIKSISIDELIRSSGDHQDGNTAA